MRPTALTTPTVTVFDSRNGLPIAITQSPGAICAESPNFADGSGSSGMSVICSSAVSVSSSRPTTLALSPCSPSSHAGRERTSIDRAFFDDVVVGQDVAGLVDDEAAARAFAGSRCGACGRGLAAAMPNGMANWKTEQLLGPPAPPAAS